jgi:hypothetical protein
MAFGLEHAALQFLETPDGTFRLMTDAEILQQSGILPSRSYRGLLNEGFNAFAVRTAAVPSSACRKIVADVRRAARFVLTHAPASGVDADRVGI